MKIKSKRVIVLGLFVLSICISIVLMGHIAGISTPSVYAELTNDEIDLCQLLSTPMGSKTPDLAAFLECIATLGTD